MGLGVTVVSVWHEDAKAMEEAVDMLRAYMGSREDDRAIEVMDTLSSLAERINVGLGT